MKTDVLKILKNFLNKVKYVQWGTASKTINLNNSAMQQIDFDWLVLLVSLTSKIDFPDLSNNKPNVLFYIRKKH